jgi:hypothetical protein
MLLRSPEKAEFISIFQSFCKAKELPCPDGLVLRLIERHYQATGKVFRRCHPRDVISHVIDLIHFEKLPYQVTEDVLNRAFEGCFVQELED